MAAAAAATGGRFGIINDILSATRKREKGRGRERETLPTTLLFSFPVPPPPFGKCLARKKEEGEEERGRERKGGEGLGGIAKQHAIAR